MAAPDNNKVDRDLLSGIALNLSFSLLERAMNSEESALHAGLQPQDVSALMSLNPSEFSQIVREMSQNIVTITVNTDNVHGYIAQYQERRRYEKFLITLLRHGASNTQIQSWFGLTYREVQSVRKANRIPAEPGKNRILNEAEVGELATAWLSASLLYKGSSEADARACLDVSDKKGIPVSFLDQLEIRKQDPA